MLKNKTCHCFILFSIFILSYNLFAYLSCNEKTKSDFEDGYFFRSTVTTDGVLKVRQWDDWWNTSWPQRIPIEINTVGINETLYDYQIWFITNTKVLVDAGKLDPAGTAIRITGPDGKTLIPFWIENWNITTSTGSKIWVKVPQIPPNTKTQIYMYIRNVSTNPLSDRDAVFDLYEDWETGQIRNVTPWSATGWVMGGSVGVKFEIHTSTDILWDFTNLSTATFNIFEGNYCIRSGTIPHSSNIYLQTSLSLSYPAKIEFYWACFSEPGFDYLSFYIGEAEQRRIGGQVGWRFESVDISLGEHIIKWEYEKDATGIAYFDRGFIDKIVVRKYNHTFDTQMSQRVVAKEVEEWSLYYRYAEYYSNVFDTQGENTKFIYSSWTVNGQTAKIYARSADYYFTVLSTYPSFSSYELPNNGDPSGLVPRGRYIQYKIVFYTDGTTTPEVSNINFTYQPLPLRAYDFNGVALSSTSIKWSWTHRATYYIDGYRIYSSTRQYSKDGGYLVITSTAEGLIAELPPDATYWIEENLQPNTQYGRYVVAYTTTVISFGGNASRNIFGKDEPRYVYTLALAPQCTAEKYETTGSPPYYQFVQISTEVWYNTKEFSFTSAISTGVGRVAYYKCIFKTTTTWDDTSSFVWYPTSQTYITGGGEEIIERPILEIFATENSNNWYFQVKSYNYDNVESGYQILGPFWFKGCPAQITDLVAIYGKAEEGLVKLTWSAPTEDADEGNLENAKFVIKYRLAGIIDTMEKFDSIYPISTSTGMVQGVIEISTTTAAGSQQTYIVTGLVPGLTYWFTIVAVDSNGNRSQVATYISPYTGSPDITKLRSRSSKVAKIKFETPSYTFYAGDASPKIKVILVDEDDDLIKSKFGAECDLLTTSSKGKFSLDGINFGITKLYILAGSNSGEFYYMDEVAGNPIITIEEVTALEKWRGKQGWSSDSQTHTVLPGKAITFRVIPKDGSYNCQIQVDKPVYIEAVDKLGNVAVDFEGVAVVTTTFNGVTISPSIVDFTLEDKGRKEVVLRNLYYAGPSSFTVNEVVTQDYKKMLFLDYYNGYVVANKGMLKTTAESGVRWFTNIYRNDPSKGLNSIAVSNGVSILCGVDGLIIRSTDSFVTYTEQNITSETLNDLVFIDNTTLVVCGNNGIIYKSTDTGISFYSINSSVLENLNSIVFVSTSVGFACGNNGVLLKTTDAAESFIQLDLPTTVDLYNIKFLDEHTGFICGKNSTLLKTEDGGTNFSIINVSTENITLYSIDFITPQIGVVCGSLGKVFISTTAGASFVDISPENSETETFYTIKMLDLNKIIVAGTNGNMFLTTDRGKTWQKVVMQGFSPQDYLWNATIISSFETKTTKVIQGRSNLVATVGLRFMYPSDVITRVNKVTVKKLGSLPDGYITAVRFGDYGSSSFLNGVAEILLPAQPIIKYTTSYFNIFVDLSEDAPLDTTIALKFDFDCINVSQGIQFGRNNLPYITYKDTTTLEYLVVVPPVVNVFIVDIDTSVYLRTYTGFDKTKVLEQGDNAIIMKFGLVTDRSISPFRILRVNLSGSNIRDEDIKVVKLYYDYPFFESNFISSATFSGGIALLEFIREQTISDKVTNYYFITAEISPEASYSRDTTEVNFSFRIDISTTFFLLDHEGVNTISSKVTAIQTSIRSDTVRIEQSRDIVYVRTLPDLVAKIPEKVYQSERIVLLPIGVSVGKRGLGLASADWIKLTVEKSTTAADKYDRFDRSSQTVVEVWHDENGDGSFDVGIDRKLGSSVFENNTAVVLFSQPEKIDKQHHLTEYATYFIICYIPKNAQPNEKLKLIISTGTSFTLGGVDITESSNFPLESPEVIIADYPDEVETKIISLAPEEAALYEQNVPIAAIDLIAFCDATLDKLVITSEGTAVSSFTVKLVKVYLDDGDLKFDATKDVLVASSTFDLLGKCELVFFNPQQMLKYKPVLVLDEKVRIFLVFDLYEDALPDKTIGVGFDPTGFNYNLPNRQKTFGYFSTQKVTLLDKRTPTKPVISPIVFLKQGIDTGQEIERKIYYTPYSNEIRFSWFSEAPYGGGIKAGYVGLATRKYIPDVYETPDIVSFKPLPTVGEFELPGLNLEHNKLYYLWVKAESNAGFSRINYVPIFIDVTSPQPSQPPQSSQPSNNIYWINCNLTDDDESFLYSVEIEERVHQENIWNAIDVILFDIQNLIKDIYFGRTVEEVKGTQIIISSRNIVSDNVVIEYNFVLSSSVPETVEVVNFKTLFASLGYKLESYNIKLSYRITNRQQNKVYYYRIKTKNIAGSDSAPSQPSKGIALSLPKDTIVELTTFPNPCDVRKRNFVISYILSKDVQEVNIKIFDLFGNLVFEKNFYKGDEKTLFGTHYVECDKSKDIPAGMYILVLETKDFNGNIERKKWKLGVIR